MVNLLLHGEHFCEIVRDRNGRTTELHEYDPGSAFYDRRTGTYKATRQFNSGAAGGQRHIDPEDILHFSHLDETDERPWSTFIQARGSWSLAHMLEAYSGEYFQRGGHATGVILVPAAMKKSARDKVQEQWLTKRSGFRGWFMSAVLRDGAKFERTGDNFSDQQLIEQREFMVGEVARWFGIPGYKLGLSTAVSFASMVEQARSYVVNSLGPWLFCITSELENKLLRADELGDVEILHDLEPLIQTEEVTPDSHRPDEQQGRRSQQEVDTELEHHATGIY